MRALYAYILLPLLILIGNTSLAATTQLATGVDPADNSLAPGVAAGTMADAFILQTSSGSDTITDVTVTLAAGVSAGLSLVEITNDGGTTVYGSVSNPASDAPTIALNANPLIATTSATQYKIRITPKSHADMPAPTGAAYAVTAYVSNWTGVNAHDGADTSGTTVTIDNLSPGSVSGGAVTAGSGQVFVAWSNPADGDLESIVVLRRTGGAVMDTPEEGAAYTVGNAIGSSTVACVVASPDTGCTDTGLINGTAYHYKIFSKDSNGNYDVGATPAGSPVAAGITIGGVVYTDEGVTNAGAGIAVRLLVNGVLAGTSVTDAGGNYSIAPATLDVGSAILVFINNDASYRGTTVSVVHGAEISDFHIYAAHTIIRNDNGGTLTNAGLSAAKGGYADTDIEYSVTGGNVTVSGAGELYLPSGRSFAPGGAVFAPTIESLGTFDSAANTIDSNGALLVSGGTFTASSASTYIRGDFTVSGGTFIHNSGTIVFDRTSTKIVNIDSTILNHVVLSTVNAIFEVTGVMLVGGNLTVTDVQQINVGTICVSGNVTATDTSVPGTGAILFTGSGTQTLSANGASGSLPAILIDKSGGSLTIQDSISITGSSWTYIAGTVISTGTITFTAGSTNNIDSGAMAFNNVVIDSSAATTTVTGTMNVNGDLTINASGLINGGTIAVSGNVLSVDASLGASTAKILFTGGGTQTLSANGGIGAIPGVEIDKTGGSLTIHDTILVFGTEGWTVTSGTVSAVGSTVQLRISNGPIDAGAMTFDDLIINSSSTITTTGILDVDGDLTITAGGTLNGGSIRVAGNLSSADPSVSGTTAITLDGTDAQNIDTTGATDLPNGTITIDKPSGIATLLSDLTLNGAGQHVTIASGTLDLAGRNLSLPGDVLTVGSAGVLQLHGDETITTASTVLSSGSTVIYTGPLAYGSLLLGNAYHHLTFNGAGSWTHTGALDANGDLTISSGTLNSGGQNVNVAGNWSNSGTYVSGANTVTLDGTAQSISGNTAFNNFTKATAAATTLTFSAGSTTTINGIATLTGATGQLLSLRSGTPGTRWNFVLGAGATKNISYVHVQDSDASGSDPSKRPIEPPNSSSSGNNVAWFTNPIIGATKISDVVSDPLNDAANPKRIPGAVIEYSIIAINSGTGEADYNSTVITDAIDAERLAFDVTAGVTFTDGATPSGVTLGAVSYSSTPAPGPYTYDYTPSPDAEGYDGNVTSVRIATTGSFTFGGIPEPSFTVKFKVKVK